MSRIQRRIFIRGTIVGALLTITVIAIDLGGHLSTTENWLYDLRARHFQYFSSKPTDQLVHVDIDDKALDITGVGTWPWPRAKLAAILDEMRLAGVKAVALDILYSEAQDAPSPSSQPTSQPADGGNDAALAEAIRRLGCVVVPESLSFDPPSHSPVYLAMVDLLRSDPSLEEAEIARRLSATPVASARLESEVSDAFVGARKQAIFERITAEAATGLRTREALKSRILALQDPGLVTPVARVLDQQFDRWDSISALERLGSPLPADAPALASASMELPPIPVLSHAAAATAFVDYKTARDGILRSVPMVANFNGRVMPQMGLSLALVSLGLSPHDLKIGAESIRIPLPDGRQITIPVHNEYSLAQERTISTVMDIPWFGTREWLTMYDWPAHVKSAQHLGINWIWAACDYRRKLEHNNAVAAEILPELCKVIGVPATGFRVRPWDDNDPNPYAQLMQRVIAEGNDFAQAFMALPASELDADGQQFVRDMKDIRLISENNAKLVVQLQEQRKKLAAELGGKSVLVGWIATGQIDVTPTSVHPKCPGVVAHGVIFNAIMTGGFWRRAPVAVTIVATVGLGLLVMLLASWTSPVWGLVVTILLGAGYVSFNGYYLFDKHDVIVGLAGPLCVLATVWTGCTLNRALIEAGERARITRRFSSYADPTLVQHILENPDQVRLEGETRELSVVFTDLAGFTSISERLGEQTVALLNEYFGLMVPLIRSQQGYVNKFLGDGIMFFFGAPIPKSNHAMQAIQSVMEMRVALEQFNEELVRRGLTKLKMRAGISTGQMVVGDAGTAERSDYTVIGDLVNFASRLEGANKATGTGVLVNDRTAELIRERFLLRPIGRLQVVGKEISVMTFEPIALLSEATERQKQYVSMTAAMVDAYIAANFPLCLAGADQFESAFGPSPLAGIYREYCRRYIETPDASFDGRIELKEK